MDKFPNDDHQPGLSLRWLPRAVMVIAVAIFLQGLVRVSDSPNSHHIGRAQIIAPEVFPSAGANITEIESSLANIFPREANVGLILNAETEKYLAQAYRLLNENSASATAPDMTHNAIPELLVRSFPGKRGSAILQLFSCYQSYKNAEARAAQTHLTETANTLLDYRPLQQHFFTPELARILFSDYDMIYSSLASQADIRLIAIEPERSTTPYPRSCDEIQHNEFF